MCSKGVYTEYLLVVDVAYVNNNLVLLQAIEKFNIQPTDTQNVAMKMQGPTQMHYTEIPVLQKFATCTWGPAIGNFRRCDSKSCKILA